MALEIIWQLRDAKGKFIAGGTQNVDELVTLFGADPTEPAMRVADAVERGLLAYLPSQGRTDLVERAERARAEATAPIDFERLGAKADHVIRSRTV